jgi:hypothetical protein
LGDYEGEPGACNLLVPILVGLLVAYGVISGFSVVDVII